MRDLRRRLISTGWLPIRRVKGKGYKTTGGMIRSMRVWEPVEGEGFMAKMEIDDGETGGTVMIWKSKWGDVVGMNLRPGDFILVKAYPLKDDPGTVGVGPKGRVSRMKEIYHD